MVRNLILIGLGLHAEHTYLPLIKSLQGEHGTRLVAVVDLESRRQHVTELLGRTGTDVPHVILLDGKPDELRELSALVSSCDIDGVIVSTNPSSHRRYLEWAASHQIAVLVDKPLTACAMDGTEESALSLVQDYKQISGAFADSVECVTVMTPRRMHAGYAYIYNIIEEAVAKLGLPITFLDIYHSCGYWNMPDEFSGRENHPYKYGYGALLHSGYHFIDLAAWLLNINAKSSPEKWADQLSVATQHTTPDDVMEQVPEDFYLRHGLGDGLEAAFSPDGRALARSFGETDANVSFRALRGGRTITLGTVKVVETGVSARSWRRLPADTYKENGMFGQDRITIHVGHALTLHGWDRPGEGEDGAVVKKFVVEVVRNNRLIGGERFATHVFDPADDPISGLGDASLSLRGKRDLLSRWLRGDAAQFSLATNDLTVQLLSAAHVAMFRQRRGLAPVSSLSLGAAQVGGEV